jgi:hypothetical protein
MLNVLMMADHLWEMTDGRIYEGRARGKFDNIYQCSKKIQAITTGFNGLCQYKLVI